MGGAGRAPGTAPRPSAARRRRRWPGLAAALLAAAAAGVPLGTLGASTASGPLPPPGAAALHAGGGAGTGAARQRAEVTAASTLPTAADAGAERRLTATNVPVLMYHYIRVNLVPSDSLGVHLSVPPAEFALQMALLNRAGLTPVRMDDVMAAVDSGAPLPPRPVVLTFDDGYGDFATDAAPILRAFGFVGTDYVVPGFIGRPNYMSMEQLQTVVREGMWIGGHTMFHQSLPSLSTDGQRATIEQCRALLRSWTGQPVTSFAYPYGAYDAGTPGVVAAAGFTNALTTADGTREDAGSRFVLPRVRVDGLLDIGGFASRLGIAVPPASDRGYWDSLNAAAAAARSGGFVAGLSSGDGGGYGIVYRRGAVHAFGDFDDRGSIAGLRLNRPVVGAAATPSGHGYWLVGADGGVFPFGDAGGYGSTGNVRLNQPVVGIAATPSGHGYWLVAADGGIFPFGDAGGYGSTGSVRLNQPMVGMAATASGRGYWLVAADGGIFPFGDAPGWGSTGGIRLNSPVAGMARSPGDGYWLVARDGGIFPFGPGTPGWGSTGAMRLAAPITGMAAPSGRAGYWLFGTDGGVFPFGPGASGYGSAVGATASGPTPADE